MNFSTSYSVHSKLNSGEANFAAWKCKHQSIKCIYNMHISKVCRNKREKKRIRILTSILNCMVQCLLKSETEWFITRFNVINCITTNVSNNMMLGQYRYIPFRIKYNTCCTVHSIFFPSSSSRSHHHHHLLCVSFSIYQSLCWFDGFSS